MAFKIVAFDIETHGLGGDPVYWSWCDGADSGGEPLEGCRDFTERFTERLLSRRYEGAVIVAHNGLRFDFLRFNYSVFVEHGFTVRVWKAHDSIRGMDFVRERKVWRLRDTVTWSPSTLADFSHTFAPSGFEKAKSPDWENEVFDVENPLHTRYAINDSVILQKAAQGYNYFLNDKFGITVRKAVTCSGFSIRALKEFLGGPIPDWPLSTDALGRESYHGGLTCAFRNGVFNDVVYLDINSSYGAVMINNPLPCGLPFRVPGKIKLPGDHLVMATVEIPVGVFPFIMARDEKGFFHRMTGIFTGVWWNFELDLQQELGGCVRNIHARYGFPSQFDGVQRFVSRLAEVRHQDYNGPLGKLAKLMTNSIYGKFSSRPNPTQLVICAEQPNDSIPYMSPHYGYIDYCWLVKNRRQPTTRIFWGSYITAKAREQLIRYLMLTPQSEWIYTDTDSIAVPRRFLKVYRPHLSSEYGKLKLEGKLITFDVRAKKVYRGQSADGTWIYRAKGIPRKLIREAFDTGTISYEQMVGLSVHIKGDIVSGDDKIFIKKATRTLSGPESCLSGTFRKGRWVPKICDHCGFDPKKLGAYSVDNVKVL